MSYTHDADWDRERKGVIQREAEREGERGVYREREREIDRRLVRQIKTNGRG